MAVATAAQGIGTMRVKSETYPVTVKQRYMLDQSTHPDCPPDLRDRWIIAVAFLIEPRLDLRRFRRAVSKLSKRHDSLRLRFARKGGDWQARIHPSDEDMVRQVDLGDVDDATFKERIRSIANEPMQLDGGIMAEMVVVHCGTRGDVLIARINHTVTDGFGMIVLVEDLMRFLIGFPVLGRGMSFGEYLSKWHRPAPKRAGEILRFWKDLHKDLPTAPKVGRAGKDLPPLVRGLGRVEVHRMLFCAEPGSLDDLEGRAASRNFAVNTLLTTAYLEAICRNFDLETVACLVCLGRTDPALSNYCGDHTLDALLPYRAMAGDDILSAAQEMALQVGKARTYLSPDTCCRGTPYFDKLIEAGLFPEQFGAYQPRPSARQNRSALRQGFIAKDGAVSKLGPYTLRMIDVNTNRRILSEMQIDLGTGDKTKGLTIDYDGIAYDAEEIRDLGGIACDLLGLEVQDVVVS